jgi:hypothetical protein
MLRRVFAALAATACASVIAVSIPPAGASAPSGSSATTYEPVLDPANFVSVIDNPYFPLPVGRVLVYRGVREGQTQIDKVTVTSQTKVAEGITARVVSDIATHKGTLLEKTFDLYAQDKQGNVWYLGEDTKAYNPDGTVDTSGSWQADVHDGEPGIIMEANPQVPDAYRQEYLAGEAEDTAWIVDRGGSVTVPYGTVHRVLTSLEFARIEPNVVDQKVYAPGVGIVTEKALAGDQEVAKLVSVTG